MTNENWTRIHVHLPPSTINIASFQRNTNVQNGKKLRRNNLPGMPKILEEWNTHLVEYWTALNGKEKQEAKKESISKSKNNNSYKMTKNRTNTAIYDYVIRIRKFINQYWNSGEVTQHVEIHTL
ncbi:1967_t:CDS:1, partial [Ambispora gerdemannii]